MVLAACTASAQAAPSALERDAQVLGVAGIDSLEFEASGTYFQFTQAPAPELPWPPFTMDGYVATLDYSRVTVHAKAGRMDSKALTFNIDSEMWAQPIPLNLYLKTEVDLETGTFKVSEGFG